MFFKIVTTIPPNDGVNRITIANEPQNPNFVDLPKFAKSKHIPRYRIKMMISPVKPTGISLFDDASKPLFKNREKKCTSQYKHKFGNRKPSLTAVSVLIP